MIRFYLSRILSWLVKLPWAEFLRVVEAARLAAETWPKSSLMTDEEKDAQNARRVEQVTRFIRMTFPNLIGWQLNVVLEIAVAWLKTKAQK